MEDKELILEAYQLISELNKAYQTCKQGLPDDLRLQQIIDQLLNQLKKAENPPQKRVHKKRQKQDLLNKGSLFDRLSCSCLPYLRKLLCLFYTFWNTLSKEM